MKWFQPWFAAELPGLRPPHGELAPSWWEEHGWSALLLGVLFTAVLAILIWRLRRPEPVAMLPPLLRARQALENRRLRPLDAAMVSEIARILRDAVRGELSLPSDELTTEQLMTAMQHGRMPADTRQAIGDFLRECDAVKFALPSPAPDPALLSRALALLAAVEVSQQPPPAEMRASVQPSSDASNPA